MARWNITSMSFIWLSKISITPRPKSATRKPTGICERRKHRTIQEEFYQGAFRKKIYHPTEELQTDQYHHERTHSGMDGFGKTPHQTFQEMKHLAKEKMLETLFSPPEPQPQLVQTPIDYDVW